MRIAVVVSLVVAAGAAGLFLAGCGGDETAVSEDTAPFERAIAQYLAEKSMGMKVAEFRSLEVSGDTARAVCRMQEESGLHKVKVTWRFEFERTLQGTWKVTDRVAQ